MNYDQLIVGCSLDQIKSPEEKNIIHNFIFILSLTLLYWGVGRTKKPSRQIWNYIGEFLAFSLFISKFICYNWHLLIIYTRGAYEYNEIQNKTPFYDKKKIKSLLVKWIENEKSPTLKTYYTPSDKEPISRLLNVS